MTIREKAAPKPTKTETNKKKVSGAEALFNAPVAFLTTPTQDNAIQLYELGFNVFPIPFAKKGGWPWKQFQYIRVHPNQLIELFAGHCNLAIMTGRTSNNLFVIDCETETTYQQQGQELYHAHIPLWSTRTGGGGGHYYLSCIEGEIANILSGELKDIEVRGNRCYVLAPPSVHPDTGVVYNWDKRESDTPPQISIKDINWLPIKLATKAKKAAGQVAALFTELSTQTRDFILNGAPIGERNNRLFAAACDMVGNDYDDYTVRQILLPIALSHGLPDKEARDTLRSAFSQPREPARKNQPIRELTHWERATNWTKEQVWQERTGQTDKATFLACCERAKLATNENGIFRASVREIAELARISAKTASLALRRLQKTGYLEYKGIDTTSQGKLWKLGKETIKYTTPKTLPGVRDDYTIHTWLSNSVVVSHSDASERGALGKAGAAVYEGLMGCKKPVMPTSLANQIKLSRYQVQRALGKLSEYGLAQREKAGWVAVPVDSDWLDEHVAAVAGTLGKGEVRKQRHAEERAKRAGEQLLRARQVEEGKRKGSGEVVIESAVFGVLYCQNCGQSIFVFEGCLPPKVCDFCAEKHHVRKGAIWLPNPPKLG